MSKKRGAKGFTADAIIKILRAVEVAQGQGTTVKQAVLDHGISEQTYYRWKKRYGAMGADDLKKLKALEKENARLKRLVADLSLDKDILKEALEGKY